MAKLLAEGYRMPKPQHMDEKLYEKIMLLLFFFFLRSCSGNIYLKVLLMKVACAVQN